MIAPAFGEASFARHLQSARAAGVEPVVAELASLQLDVDTPDDLAALRTALDGSRGVAPNTVGMLRQLARSEGGARTAAR